jgi:hypothetical protein
MKFKNILSLLETEDPNETTYDYMKKGFDYRARQEKIKKEREESKKKYDEEFSKLSKEKQDKILKQNATMQQFGKKLNSPIGVILMYILKKVANENDIRNIISDLSILKSMAYEKERGHSQFMPITKEDLPISTKYSIQKKANYVNNEMEYKMREKITNELRHLMNKYISLIQNKDKEFYTTIKNLKTKLDNL